MSIVAKNGVRESSRCQAQLQFESFLSVFQLHLKDYSSQQQKWITRTEKNARLLVVSKNGLQKLESEILDRPS